MKSGQALVTLLVFAATAIIIASGAAVVTIVNSQGTSKFMQGEEALSTAEAGADNAILRILRDPNYTGETITVGGGTATITVTPGLSKTIISTGVSGNFIRKIQVDCAFNNNVLTITGWKEID